MTKSCHAELICQYLAPKLTRTDQVRPARDDTGLVLLSRAQREGAGAR
ncbi:MAG TPA: hypothetical protein VGN81_01290 [Pseudonocardiaceae bacterium]